MKKNNAKRAAAADKYAAMIQAGALAKTPTQVQESLGRTGHGLHDSRSARTRTRQTAKRAAIGEYR